MCVCVCVRARARACVRACVRAHMHASVPVRACVCVSEIERTFITSMPENITNTQLYEHEINQCEPTIIMNVTKEY